MAAEKVLTDHVPSMDRWLRFDSITEKHYEHARGNARRKHLQYTILFGLIFYNVYNLTSFFLMPDIVWLTIAMRVALVTPGSCILAYLVLHASPRMREWLVTVGMINAFTLPLIAFWYTTAPLGAYAFSEQALTLTYGNMLLALRFRHAVMFSIVSVATACLFAATKAGLPDGLMFALCIQMITAGCFTLAGNYLIERRRCEDFLTTLHAKINAENAQTASYALEVLTKTDPLTGLLNRRGLDELLDQAHASDQSLAVMMIDVDHFKMFNDTCGHPAGDSCLIRLAETLNACTHQPGVYCARYGGEEFTILVIDKPPLEVVRIAKQLIQSVRTLNITHPGRSDGKPYVTISIGISAQDGSTTQTIAEVMNAADDALYLAKTLGRDQYRFSDQIEAKLVSGG
ncbi:GGDEF domain-containing protein [Loktanella agnita]